MYWTLKKTNYFNRFIGNLLIPYEQRFCRTCVKSFVNRAFHLFSRSNKVFSLHLINLALSNFNFDLNLQFYFLKWNHYFSAMWKFAKFFISFWKTQVIFPSNFALIFSVVDITLLYYFSSNIVYFGQWEPIKL